MAQYHLLHLLAAKYRNLCVVGDDDQSVYRFRGANVRNILNFERDYPDATVIKLEQNYRSTGLILEAAMAVVTKNPDRKDKTLWTENVRGRPIGYFCAQDELHEAEVVGQNIAGLHREEGLSYRDIAVFYRTNAQSRVLEDALRQAGIAYQVVGGLRFYDRQEIKDVLAYLRLLVNPRDTLSLRRIINIPRRGIGATTVARLEEFAMARGLSGLEALPAFLDTDLVNRGAQSKLRGFYTLLQALRTETLRKGAAEMTRAVLEWTGYAAQLEAEHTVEAQTRLENVRELVNAADEFDRQAEEPSLQTFLEHTALLSDHDHLDHTSGAAVLMTLHASKGLEFPVVFIVGMEDGLFPHSRAVHDPAEMEEERRLCYVGMTRAQTHLFLMGTVRRRIYGTEQFNPPSRFLADIPATCLQDYSRQPVVASSLRAPQRPVPAVAAAMRGPTLATPRNTRTASTPYAVGTQVQHQHFGRGVVQKREGEGDDLKLTVIFRDHGIKKVLVKFAPMQPR